jgi:hypothetical protein
MHSRWTVLAAAAATLWVAPLPAAAGEDVEDQLRQMNERMAQMEQQLQATQEELAASKQRVDQQQEVIQQIDADREASSALSKFLSETEFSGVAAASYTYNFKSFNSSAVGRNGNSTTAGENASLFGIVAPIHQNSNNFQVDQLALRMKKTATPESRAGWGASIVYGTSADWVSRRSNVSCGTDEDGDDFCVRDDDDVSGDLPILFEAYAAYLWDVGSGVKSTLGRYVTPVGAESFFANENFNVTRGLLWALQPKNHTGGNLSGEFGEAIAWQVGASNGYGNTMSNTDTHPTFVGSVGYKADTLGFKVNGVYGGNIDDLFAPSGVFGTTGTADSGALVEFDTGLERNGDKIGLLDAVLTWDPSDSLATWVNFDYYWLAKTGQGTPGIGAGTFDLKDLNIWGIAGAGRYAITESTGFSLRYEYLSFNNFGPNPDEDVQKNDANLMSVTATLDHHLTDNLVLSAEGRWDRGRFKRGANRIYLNDEISGPTSSASAGSGLTASDFNDPTEEGDKRQVLGLVQLRYDF